MGNLQSETHIFGVGSAILFTKGFHINDVDNVSNLTLFYLVL